VSCTAGAATAGANVASIHTAAIAMIILFRMGSPIPRLVVVNLRRLTAELLVP
jgi:hypothetical protein